MYRSYILLVVFSQDVGVPRSWDLLTLGILKMIRSTTDEFSYLVWTLLIGTELPILQVLGVSNSFTYVTQVRIDLRWLLLDGCLVGRSSDFMVNSANSVPKCSS